jgi:hypothetical protein
MPTNAAERQALQQSSINRWERERQQRVEALCGAITYQRTALRKVGNAVAMLAKGTDSTTQRMGSTLNDLHAALREAINEPNPFDRLPYAVTYDDVLWMVHGNEYAAGEKTGKWVLKRTPADRRRSSYDWAIADPSDCTIVEEGDER